MAIEQVFNAGFLFTQSIAAVAPQQQPGGGYEFLFTMVLVIVVLYFLMIRPQNKRAKEHNELISRLGQGDEVVMTGGMLGRIVKVSDQYLTVEIADGVEILVQRHHVGVVLPKDTIKTLKK